HGSNPVRQRHVAMGRERLIGQDVWHRNEAADTEGPPARRGVESLDVLEMAQERAVKAAMGDDLQRVSARLVNLERCLSGAVKLNRLIQQLPETGFGFHFLSVTEFIVESGSGALQASSPFVTRRLLSDYGDAVSGVLAAVTDLCDITAVQDIARSASD